MFEKIKNFINYQKKHILAAISIVGTIMCLIVSVCLIVSMTVPMIVCTSTLLCFRFFLEYQRLQTKNRNHMKLNKAIVDSDLDSVLELLLNHPIKINKLMEVAGEADLDNTFLMRAITHQKQKIFSVFLKKNDINVNHINRNGDTALTMTLKLVESQEKIEQMVKQLLAVPGINLNKGKIKAISTAITKKYWHIVQILIDAGAHCDQAAISAIERNTYNTVKPILISNTPLEQGLLVDLVLDYTCDVTQISNSIISNEDYLQGDPNKTKTI